MGGRRVRLRGPHRRFAGGRAARHDRNPPCDGHATLRQPGVAGSALLNGRTTLMLDIFELADTVRGAVARGEWWRSGGRPAAGQWRHGPGGRRFRFLPRPDQAPHRSRRIQGAGGGRRPVRLGAAGSATPSEISVVTTDVEMPRLDGLASDETHSGRCALCPLAGDRAFHSGRRRGDGARACHRGKRVPGQARPEPVARKHSQSGQRDRSQAVAGRGIKGN